MSETGLAFKTEVQCTQSRSDATKPLHHVDFWPVSSRRCQSPNWYSQITRSDKLSLCDVYTSNGCIGSAPKVQDGWLLLGRLHHSRFNKVWFFFLENDGWCRKEHEEFVGASTRVVHDRDCTDRRFREACSWLHQASNSGPDNAIKGCMSRGHGKVILTIHHTQVGNTYLLVVPSSSLTLPL